MEYIGTIGIDHHSLSVEEFTRLMPIMDRSRIVTRKADNSRYHEGTITIANNDGIELNISLFSVTIGD